MGIFTKSQHTSVFKKTGTFLLAASILVSCHNWLLLPSQAASSDEIKSQIDKLQKDREQIQIQMENIKKQYKQNEDEIVNMIARKNVIDQEIGSLHLEIDNINQQISSFNQLIADKQAELDQAQQSLVTLEEQTVHRIRTMEEEGPISYWEVIFQANSFSDFLDRVNMIDEIATADQERVQALTNAAQTVADAQEALTLEKASREAVRKELEEVEKTLDQKRKEADDLIAELISHGVELEDLRSQITSQDEQLLEEIARMEKAYNDAKYQEWLDDMATATPPPSDGDSGDSDGDGGGDHTPTVGGWQLPCNYVKLTSPFGNRESPTTGGSTFHQGVDLSAPAGTPIYASRSGVVTTARYGNAAGYYVTISHGDGFSSIYMHMTNYIVTPGQTVSAGQTIGYVGRTGIATGNHLHFGIAYNGSYVNPATYISFY